jgi:hypothetical protein
VVIVDGGGDVVAVGIDVSDRIGLNFGCGWKERSRGLKIQHSTKTITCAC